MQDFLISSILTWATKKTLTTFHYTGWLIMIVKIVYYNPYIMGSIIPYIPQATRVFLHCSPHLHVHDSLRDQKRWVVKKSLVVVQAGLPPPRMSLGSATIRGGRGWKPRNGLRFFWGRKRKGKGFTIVGSWTFTQSEKYASNWFVHLSPIFGVKVNT